MWNEMKSHRFVGTILAFTFQDITSHTCSFQDYIVLFWFFFFILGQDETSSWGIWKNSFDSNKHKFALLPIVSGLEFRSTYSSRMCCESYYIALFCDSDCDFVITFARTKWQHFAIQYYLMIELLPQAEVYGFIMCYWGFYHWACDLCLFSSQSVFCM